MSYELMWDSLILWLTSTNESGPDMIEEILSFVAPIRESFHTPPQDFTAGKKTTLPPPMLYMQFRQDFYQSIIYIYISFSSWFVAPTFAKEFSAQVGLGAWEQAQWGLQAGERGAWLPNWTFRSKTIVLLKKSMFVSNNATINALTNQIMRCLFLVPKRWCHRHLLVRRYLCM